jgi:dTDP-4-dehydrorhamnose reductase
MKANLTPITSEEFGALAHRPTYSVLATDALESIGVARPRPWREALAVYLDERKRKSGAS